MARGVKGHAPTTKASTKAVSGSFMGTAIPPQLARINRKPEHMRDGQVRKADRVRFS